MDSDYDELGYDNDDLGYFDSDEDFDESLYLDESTLEIPEVKTSVKMIVRGKFTDIPIDIIREIYLNVDIDSLVNFIKTNKLYNKAFNDLFWIEKFKHDDLPNDETLNIPLMEKYIYAIKASNLIKLNALEQDMYPGIRGFNINVLEKYSDELLFLIPDEYKDLYILSYDIFIRPVIADNKISYRITFDISYYDNKTRVIDIIVTRHQLINFIVKYVFTKKVTITDNKELPYSIRDINEIFDDNIKYYNLDKKDKTFNSVKLLNQRKKWLEKPYYDVSSYLAPIYKYKK